MAAAAEQSTTNQVTIPTRATIRYERVSMAIALAFFVVAIVLSVPAFSGVAATAVLIGLTGYE